VSESADVGTDVLTVESVQVKLGDSLAVSDVSMGIRQGGFTGIIGPNGAGKTTLLNAVSGLCRVNKGKVRFEGRDITNARAHAIAKAGIARTFQGVQLVPYLSALTNVMVGRHTSMRSTIVATGAGIGRSRGEERRARQEALDALALVGAAGLAGVRADRLAYGQQKLIELARAVALRPRLLLLDEPTSGMTQAEKDAVIESVLAIRAATSMTLAIIEHDVSLVRRVCEELVVMEAGLVIAAGPTTAVLALPQVQEAYLGSAAVQQREEPAQPREAPR
jgi:ABC-type branched-subunit amino acid transport system ATPase component